MRAAAHAAIVTNELPVLAAIIGPPELSAISFLTSQRNALACFDHRVDAIRIAARDRQRPLAGHAHRQAMSRNFFPRRPAIARHEETATRPATLSSPRVNLERPHAGKQGSWIVWIHHQVRTSCAPSREQHPVPMRAAVSCAKHTSLRLWSIRVPQSARHHDVRILRINHEMTDAPGFLETHQLPGLAGISRFVDSLPDRDMTADPSFTSSRPNNIWIRRSNRQRSNRRHRLRVKDGFPMNAAVDRLEDSAGRRPGVIDERLTGHADDRGRAIANGSYIPPAHRVGVHVLS